MLAENAPACVCGSHSFSGGGGSFSPGFCYTCFHCTECGRNITVFEGCMGCAPITFMAPKDVGSDDYFNLTMVPVWRRAEADGERRPYPPQLPKGMDAFMFTEDGAWERVDKAHSASLSIPPDPLRVEHDEFWQAVMEELGIEGAEEVQNGYYDDRRNSEPWYQWRRGDRTFKFGPRKRVYNITVTSDVPFNTSGISAAAEKANTTYYADGGWQNWRQEVAKEVTVHAWGRGPLVEYFKLLMEAESAC